MTNSIEPQPPNLDPQQSNVIKRLWRRLKSSPKQAGIGLAAIAVCGSLGYWGIDFLVKRKLPPFLERQIGDFIERPIDLGEVERFSLSGIELGKTTIPPTAKDQDQVEVAGIKIGFNLFPVIFRATLPLEFSIIRPDIYVEQSATGEWLNLDFLPEEKKELPINFDVGVDIEKGAITALPYGKDAIEVKVDGSGRYSQAGEQLATYDLDATIAEATANVVGETVLATGKTDTKLLVEDLALSEVATLIPNLPVEINRGRFNADLDLDIPSWQEFTAADIKGNVSLHDLAGEVRDLSAPVSGESQLNFQGREGDVITTEASLGDIIARVDGKVNLDHGYNLDAEILPFSLSNLPAEILQQLPVKVAGEMAGDLQLRGAIKEPLLTGKINNKSGITVDKTQLKKVEADFTADLGRIILRDLQLIPVAGGEVTAQGVVETNFKDNRQLDIDTMPLAFNFTAQLPTQDIVTPYYQLPTEVGLGNLAATGKINGTIGNLEAIVDWQLAEIDSNVITEDITGVGKLIFAERNLNLQDTLITVGDGQLDVAAIASLDNKRWQADVTGNALYLTPYLAPFSNENFNLNRPVAVKNADFKFNGKTDNFSTDSIQGEVDLQLDVDGNEVAINSKLTEGNVNAVVTTNRIGLNPFIKNLPVTAAIDSSRVNVRGKIKPLLGFADNPDLSSLQGDIKANLDIDNNDVVLDSRLTEGNVNAVVTTNRIELNPFIKNLPVTAAIDSSRVNVRGKIKPLLGFANNPDLSSLQADVMANLDIDNNDVVLDSQLTGGNIQGNVTTNTVNLNNIAPALPIPATLQASKTNFSGELKQLLEFQQNPNLSTFKAELDADLIVAQGAVKANGGLNNNQWQTNIDANNISTALLLNKFVPDNYKSLNLDNINAQAEFTGNINPLINNEVNIPIDIKQVAVQSGEQNFSTKGDLTLSNITTNPDIADTNLDINANIDFDRLPLDEIIAQSTNNNELLAESIRITGKTQFDGQLQGKNLITAANISDNISLTGELQLLDFAFNEIEFDRVMAGKVNVQPASKIELNLKGDQDIIAATAVPCKTNQCSLPYLPTNLELRQGEETKLPVIAQGNRQGDIFTLDIDNFPLSLLNITPAKAAGIQGALAGKTTGKLAVDLYSLAAKGKIKIDNPAVGYIDAQQITADFNYNPAKNVAEVRTASLDLGESEYNVNANLDLQTGAIAGKLEIPEAYIQDILTTLRWFTIEDAIYLFNTPEYPSSVAVRTTADIDTVEASITRKVDLLQRIENKIQANAEAKQASNIPNELDITGKYSGEIAFGGTLDNPNAKFEITGKNWQWQPQQPYTSIAPTSGLVKEANQSISIPHLAIKGDFQGNIVDLETATVQVEDAILSLAGKLSPETEDANFQVKNLTVDTIKSFVDIPVDLAGEINTKGTIKGSPSKPQIAGNITFSNGAFNGNVLPTAITGDFAYTGEKLDFQTTAPNSIQVDASVPYPIVPGESDRLNANVNLETEAFKLLGALSQNYLNWLGGKGNARLKAEGKLDLEKEGVLYDLKAEGVVNLKDAKINLETPFFSETFTGAGKITLDNQIVNVETLNGTFANKDLSVTGKLPILTVVNNLDAPLTLNLPPGKIDIKKLYKGEVAGKINITGAALQPVVSGKIGLYDGKVSIPKTESQPEDTAKTANNSPSKVTVNSTNTPANNINSSDTSAVITTLNDLEIELEDFNLKQTPLYDFSLTGNLNLNGTIDTPNNIKSEGTLKLNRADVDWLSSSFNLVRNRENKIVFTPEEGALNPYLDVQLKTEVSELNDLRLAESGINELSDPLSQGRNTELITVFLAINGETKDILPNLNQAAASCQIRPNDTPLVEASSIFSQQESSLLTRCFNEIALNGSSNVGILNSSAVTLNSIPNRSQGEIVSLLGNKFLAFAEQLGNSSQQELLELGFNHFIVAPTLRRLLYRVDDAVVSGGKKIGLDYLRLYPNLEGIYEINEDSSIRSTYNYVFNEVKMEYELRF